MCSTFHLAETATSATYAGAMAELLVLPPGANIAAKALGSVGAVVMEIKRLYGLLKAIAVVIEEVDFLFKSTTTWLATFRNIAVNRSKQQRRAVPP